jgi:hypothetical protein
MTTSTNTGPRNVVTRQRLAVICLGVSGGLVVAFIFISIWVARREHERLVCRMAGGHLMELARDDLCLSTDGRILR